MEANYLLQSGEFDPAWSVQLDIGRHCLYPSKHTSLSTWRPSSHQRAIFLGQEMRILVDKVRCTTPSEEDIRDLSRGNEQDEAG